LLQIEISRRADGAAVLRCTREDGSFTWQKQAKHGAHFVLHDLTHYAVETALGYRRGFFALIAEGWEPDDTTGVVAGQVRGYVFLPASAARPPLGTADSAAQRIRRSSPKPHPAATGRERAPGYARHRHKCPAPVLRIPRD